MYKLGQLGYTDEEVKRILEISREIAFEYDLLDKNEICIGKVTASGSIDCDTTAKIVRGGKLNIREINDVNYVNERIRPKMKVKTDRGWLTYSLGIYLLSSPNTSCENESYLKETEIYDKSTILEEDKFTVRQRYAAGTGYTDNVVLILNSAGIVKTNITASDKELTADIEFEIGTSKLDAINTLLKSINYNNLYFDSNGTACVTPYVLPSLRNEEDTYQTSDNSIVYPKSVKNSDLFNCPNIIVRYCENPDRDDELIATYTNDSKTDELSTVNRRRNIVDVESVFDIADQETLEDYVARLAEEKQVYETICFDTALMPHHSYLDCLNVNIESNNFTGKCIETRWSMDLRVGGRMSHVCRRVAK